MNILRFVEEFPDEQSCITHFKKCREKEGLICKKCNSKDHYWLKNKNQWECKACKFRTTLRSGTIMHGSNLKLRIWYLAMAFMSFSKKGISAKELQRQLGYNRYDTIWLLMHKIRDAMGKRDNLYSLKDMVEFDEGYFEKATSEKVKLKRGRGSQRQKNVAVMGESIPLTKENGSTCRYPGYFKMKVLTIHHKDEINQVVQDNLEDKSIVFSDKSTSYVNISNFVEAHLTEKSDKTTTKETLKWVHIAISNAKRNLLGVYHKIKGKYLQAYLDEFCYKLNRRYFGERLFDRLVLAVAKIYR